MKPTLPSWGSAKFTWREGRTYIRTHGTNRGKPYELMVMLFKVENIKGSNLIGKEVLSGQPIKLWYKSNQAQEFEALNNKKRHWLTKFIFEGDNFNNPHDKKSYFVLWNPSGYNDTGWS